MGSTRNFNLINIWNIAFYGGNYKYLLFKYPFSSLKIIVFSIIIKLKLNLNAKFYTLSLNYWLTWL